MGNVLRAAKSGDMRELLQETRDKLAYAIDTCESMRDLAALTKRLIEVTEKLAAMPSEDNSNEVDNMAAFIAEYDEYEDPRLEEDVD